MLTTGATALNLKHHENKLLIANPLVLALAVTIGCGDFSNQVDISEAKLIYPRELEQKKFSGQLVEYEKLAASICGKEKELEVAENRVLFAV